MAKPAIIRDLPIARPKKPDEMRRLISDTYKEQPWDIGEARRYEIGLGLKPMRLNERTKEELNMILDRMELTRMVLFK